MSQFKYEIDERNLRLQLRAMEVPYSEEAWHKFENFSASCKTGIDQRAVKRFQLSFNRNVVLPVVFGSVIVLFSLLLFNFVNIKNPDPKREARAESMAAGLNPASAEEKKVEAVPAETAAEPVAQPAQQEPAAENKASEAKPVAPQEQQAAVAEVKEQPSQLPPAEPVREVSSQIRITKSHASSSDSQAVNTEVRKKKSKKRQEVVVEPVPGEEEQAPPPVETVPASGE